MNKLLIGIAGQKRNGKDLLCSLLIDKLGEDVATRLAFADPLRREVAEVLTDTELKDPNIMPFDRELAIEDYLDEMMDETIDPKTGQAVKVGYRLILQWWGTEFRRNKFGDTYWLDQHYATSIKQKQPIVIVPDCRFLNEAQYVKDNGGVVISIKRPGFENNDPHPSEREIDMIVPDYEILNNAGVDELRATVNNFITNAGLLDKIKEMPVGIS